MSITSELSALILGGTNDYDVLTIREHQALRYEHQKVMLKGLNLTSLCLHGQAFSACSLKTDANS